MCGIVGYFDYGDSGYELPGHTFDEMIDLLAHRGPDGRGRVQLPGVGLGHRRLAILDTTDRAAQPMAAPFCDVHLTYNGEIYNFRELREELEALGHVFQTTSDTEVLLHSYLEWDTGCVARLTGIFAFGLYDGRKKRLWLVRDHIGVKPLFYADNGRRVLFASETPALLAAPDVGDELDAEGIDAYFTFSYCPAPLTGYRDIRQLQPGSQLLVENGRVTESRYWDLPLPPEKLTDDEPALIEQFDELLTRAVKRQMVSDVPLGAFLSSGTDSFGIVRAMESVSPGRTRAFSVGFADPRFDELPYSRMAAEALGVSLETETVGVDVGELTERVRPFSRDPSADSSSLPTYLLCQMARKHVTVALSGDGADEMLGGYATYRAAATARKYRRLPRWLRSCVIEPIARRLPDVGGKYSLRDQVNRLVHGAAAGPDRDHAAWRVIFTPELKDLVYTDDFRAATRSFDPLDRYAGCVRRAREAGCEDLDALLYADQVFYLPNDMLAKVDRMSMAHSLEVRVPFLDVDLVEFCWRLPTAMKLSGKIGKWILRRAIADRYPDELSRRPKSGFNMAADRGAERAVRVDHRLCKSVNIPYSRSFGRYHQLMIRYLLAQMPS